MAGVLVALHFDEVGQFVERWVRQLIGLGVAIGVAATMWYLIAVGTGSGTGRASDLYQSIAFLWFTAAVAALEGGTWWWFRRTMTNGQRARLSVGGLFGQQDRWHLILSRSLPQPGAFRAGCHWIGPPPRVGRDGGGDLCPDALDLGIVHRSRPAYTAAMGAHRTGQERTARPTQPAGGRRSTNFDPGDFNVTCVIRPACAPRGPMALRFR